MKYPVRCSGSLLHRLAVRKILDSLLKVGISYFFTSIPQKNIFIRSKCIVVNGRKIKPKETGVWLPLFEESDPVKRDLTPFIFHLLFFIFYFVLQICRKNKAGNHRVDNAFLISAGQPNIINLSQTNLFSLTQTELIVVCQK
jgi:hypothetical protein